MRLGGGPAPLRESESEGEGEGEIEQPPDSDNVCKAVLQTGSRAVGARCQQCPCLAMARGRVGHSALDVTCVGRPRHRVCRPVPAPELAPDWPSLELPEPSVAAEVLYFTLELLPRPPPEGERAVVSCRELFSRRSRSVQAARLAA